MSAGTRVVDTDTDRESSVGYPYTIYLLNFSSLSFIEIELQFSDVFEIIRLLILHIKKFHYCLYFELLYKKTHTLSHTTNKSSTVDGNCHETTLLCFPRPPT